MDRRIEQQMDVRSEGTREGGREGRKGEVR